MTPETLAERLDALRELEALAVDIAHYERRWGIDAESSELRSRLDSSRAVILRQVAGYICGTGAGGCVH